MNSNGRLVWEFFEKNKAKECLEDDPDWEKERDWDEELCFEDILNWLDMYPEYREYFTKLLSDS